MYRNLKLILALCFSAATAFAQTAVRSSCTPLIGDSGNYAVTFYWAADGSGNVPSTPASLQGCPGSIQGYRILSVTVSPGTPAPTNNFTVKILDPMGVDMMGGAMATVSNASAQAFGPPAGSPPINGTLSLALSGNSVAGAQGRTVVYFGRVQLFNSTPGGTGPAGPPGPSSTPTATSVGTAIYVIDSGSANAYAGCPATSTALQDGLLVELKVANSNTTASTFNYCAGGAVAIVDQAGNALAVGVLVAGTGGHYLIRYSTSQTNWQIMGSCPTVGAGLSVTGCRVSPDLSMLASVTAIQQGILVTITTTSSSPTIYTGTTSPVMGSYTKDQVLTWDVGATGCTGSVATTINLNSLGAVRVFEADGATNPVVGDCPTNRILRIAFDGTAFRIVGGGAATGGGGGGGSTSFSQLTDFAYSNNGGSLAAIGSACAIATPCQTRQMAVVGAALTAPCTFTLSGTSVGGVNNAFAYITNTQQITMGHNTASTVTASAGCFVATGITSFPPNSIPLAAPTFTSLVWNPVTAAMDKRTVLSQTDVEPGADLTCSDDPSTGIRTCTTNPNTVPRYSAGSGAPGGTCTAGRDFYTDTVGLNLYFCDAANTWKQGNGGTGFPITPGTYYEYDNFLSSSTAGAGALGGGLLAWGSNSNSGGSTATQQVASATSLGSVQITTGATTANDAEWLRGTNGSFKNFHTASNFQMRTSVIGVTADANTVYRFGLSDSAVIAYSQPANGVYIEKAAADTQWFGVCRTAATQTRSTALATVTGGSQIAFQISFVSSGTIAFKTAATVAGLASASAINVTTNCPSIAAAAEFGVATAANAAKSLGLFFYDMYITGLGY
jgi:hypothetical protein